jgi:hypothetical protein
MHSNFDFSARQILWTVNFAAQLVLLVVLLGRDRIRRYPWFTAAIGLMALRLIAEELLAGRLAPLLYQEVLIVIGDLSAILGLLVVVEVARRAFVGAIRSMWIVNTVGLLVVAGGLLAYWGPWPPLKELAWDSLLGKLRLLQIVAMKGEMLVAMLAVGVGVMVVLFGRRFKAGWRSHTQQIAIGLSTVAIALLALQGTVQSIVKTAHPHSQEEYQQIIALMGNLVNANRAIYVGAVLWWTYWLWQDEPGAEKIPAAETLVTETPKELESPTE